MKDDVFNTGEPLAYFLTWTTYGTWLPGDERGWRRKGKSEPQPGCELFKEMAKSAMTETAFFLALADREIVEDTIRKHCEIRKWILHAVHARSNHVHVVVTAPGYAPETVRDQFKAWCTRKLKPHHTRRENFWTEGASRRYLNTEDALGAAVEYVKDSQDRKGVES